MSTAAQPLSDPFAAYGGKTVTAPPDQAADPFAAYGGKSAAASPIDGAAAPQSATPASSGAGEGLYSMRSPDGRAVQIPYSKVHTQMQNGYLFQDKPTLQKYARDQAADPLSEDRIDQFLDKHPWIAAPVRALMGAGSAALQTATAFDRTPTTRGETEAQIAAATPAKGLAEQAGAGGEGLAEVFTGDELLGLLGKGAKALQGAQKYEAVAKLAKLLEANPTLARLAKIGSTAVKQGSIGGAQTFVKTGGDAGAAATAAGETALMSGGLSALGATGAAIKTARAGTGEAEAAAEAARVATATEAAETANTIAEGKRAANSAAYSDQARGAIKGQLEGVNAARRLPEREVQMNQPSHEENVTMNQPGGEPGVPTGRRVTTPAVPTGTMARPTETPQIDVDKVLNTVHDFTGAADRLTEVNQAGYENLDQLTGRKFRALNTEVTAAQKAVWKSGGANDAVTAYQNKLAEMGSLFDSLNGKVKPEELGALKASWTQSYALRDLGKIWDKNLRGLPGSSDVSNAQRGINGKGLRDGLVSAIKTYTRPKLEQMLGPGRLENLERIAENNMTDKQRQVFNGGVRTVAQELEKLEQEKPTPTPAQGIPPVGRRAIAMAVGGGVSHLAGASPYYGMVAGEAGYEATHAVMNALKANPKIAQNFMFALESGATAKRYGPFIAALISKSQTEGHEQRQAEESREGDQQ